MPNCRIVAFVLAGGRGSRLYPLTAECAKPALPFTDRCLIIDFVLSNLLNSGVNTVYVLAQYKPTSLLAHLHSEWRSGTGERFINVLLPPVGSGGFQGTADAVYQSLFVLERHRPDLVAVFAADQIYRMDVRQFVDFHTAAQADVSVAALPVPCSDADRFGVVVTANDRRVVAFQEKPRRPESMPGRSGYAYASMGNYLFNRDVLAVALQEAHQRGHTDFGHHLLPRLIRTHRVFAYDFTNNRVPGSRPYEDPAYWRDVGTIEALHAAQRDTMGPRPRLALDNPAWPVPALSPRRRHSDRVWPMAVRPVGQGARFRIRRAENR